MAGCFGNSAYDRQIEREVLKHCTDNCHVCGKFVKYDAVSYCDICENTCHDKCGIYTSGSNESNSSQDSDTFHCQKCIDEYEDRQREADQEVEEFDNW